VFIIFAHGKEILNKIRKISESLGATLYPVDDNADKRQESLAEITARIEDLNSVLQNTNNARRAELLKVADDLTAWNTIIKKEKAIYHTMNLFNYDVNRKCLIAEGWCPTNYLNQIHQALRTATVLYELVTTCLFFFYCNYYIIYLNCLVFFVHLGNFRFYSSIYLE